MLKKKKKKNNDKIFFFVCADEIISKISVIDIWYLIGFSFNLAEN